MKTPLNPAPRGHMLFLVKVRASFNRNGAKVWTAKCRAPRCKFAEPHMTHNGAHSAAARHRREKALTKMHGATEATA